MRAASKPPIKYCAVYTRKSTEEGLEQEFNTLDAQREGCLAFITRQKAEGWVALPDNYDDGGYSGGKDDPFNRAPHEIQKWLVVFLRRFHASQFKRAVATEGPKIGSISFDPRGDWRMPSDISMESWVKEAEGLDPLDP